MKHVQHAAAAQRIPQDLLQHTTYAGHSARGHGLDEARGVVERGCNNSDTVRLVDIAAFEGEVRPEFMSHAMNAEQMANKRLRLS